ncbi:addiction module antitoxin [Methylococcaceae bacterium CS1]|nr:addiction module antitoxin [Methylococcaceae bacterium CS4]TXK99520.1 addiction module antitoxin [Methylococcaceae bacterium CS5]TXL04663.1 addiction module antitoxin [Methylococcaceae bacterium CS3]TXL07613.1 addiction module antitoxin [Methylococcaceae bacterium CS1]TXL11459.1 addiction module antitoxin [Methylococcaceae bacterium CS2]
MLVVYYATSYFWRLTYGNGKKSITVTEQQNVWIKAQIITGHYGNESEFLRDLIRKEQNKNADIEAIRVALIKAEGRGIGSRTPDQIKEAVQKRLKNNGNL